MKNWKTTSAGISAIVGGITGLIFSFKGGLSPEIITTSITAILTGIGLIFAKDFDISHTQK